MNNTQLVITILIIVLVTMLTRFLPFIIFGNNRPTPEFVTYLGKVLPYSIMGMLVVYCLRNMNFLTVGSWAPEIIATATVVLLHVWRRNMLVSIIVGTAVYMFLVQVIF